jgi:hypothetical protein
MKKKNYHSAKASLNSTFYGGRNKTEKNEINLQKTSMIKPLATTTTNSLIIQQGDIKSIQQSSTSYPLPIKEIESEFDELKQLNEFDEVQKLKKLFLLYSSNEKRLYSQKFLKLLSDSKILDKNFDSKYADIIFYTGSRSKNCIDFNEFCEIMVKISEIKFPNEYMKNQSKALDKLCRNNLFSLLKLIIETNSNKDKKVCNWEIYLSKMNTNKNVLSIEKNSYCISKIYLKYFPWEPLNVSNYQKANLSEKAFFRICKDFEICPNQISLIKLSEIYQNVMVSTKLILNIFETISFSIRENGKLNLVNTGDISNKGTYFTFYHLIAAFYLISIQMMLNMSSYKNEYMIDNFINEEDTSIILYNYRIF